MSMLPFQGAVLYISFLSSQGVAHGLMIYMAFSQFKYRCSNATQWQYNINPMPTAWGKNPMASPRVHNQIVRQLYAKYGLSEEEVAFIEGMIKVMG